MQDNCVYVVVVGHNLEAKCDVANALSNDKKLFRTFSCRKKKVIKHRSTINGKYLYIVATPDLNTPSWTHLERDLKSFKTKVFLYVQDNSCIDNDDSASVQMLRTRFTEKTKIKPKMVKVQYNFSSANDNEAEDGDDQIIINKRDTFGMKCDKACKVMKLITDLLGKSTGKFHGGMAVDDRKVKVRKGGSSVSLSKKDLEADATILDSVETSGGIGPPEGEDFINIQLPKLDNEDWDLFRKTLRLGRARSNHVRVIVVGNQGAGKTTLVKRLQQIDIKCPDESQKATESIEVSQVTTRCAEREGVRHWETKTEGYEQELNLQRMVFALQYAESCVNEPESGAKNEVLFDQKSEFELGSEEVPEEGQVQTTFEHTERLDIAQKEFYLQLVKHWKDNSEEERMYVSYWDFAGQSTYYSTHQAFMAPSAVYVLVIDLSMGLDEKLADQLQFRTGLLKQYSIEETVKFWISSVKAYTRDEQNGRAPFIIVGTHKDKVTDEDAKEQFNHLRKILKNLTQVDIVAIDNTCSAGADTHLIALRNKILDLGLGVIDEEIPARWINLENTLLHKKRLGNDFLSLADIKKT